MLSQAKTIYYNLFASTFLVLLFAACSPKIQRTSDDSGYSSLSTRSQEVAINSLYDGVLKASAIKSNNFYYLYLRVEIPAEKIRYFRIDVGDTVVVKFSDNASIILTNVEKMRAVRQDSFSGSVRYANADCPLTNAQIQKIITQDITSISVSSNTGSFDFDIDAKGSKAIQKQLWLIVTTRE